MKASLRSSISYSEQAVGRFEITVFDGQWPKKYELKATLAHGKQGGDSVNVYYSRLEKLWDELEKYTQLLFSAINYEVLIFLTKEREEEKIYQFLMGLNEDIFLTFHQV